MIDNTDDSCLRDYYLSHLSPCMGLKREIVLSVHQYNHLHIVECVENKAKAEDQYVVP